MSAKLSKQEYAEATKFTFKHFAKSNPNKLNPNDFSKLFGAISSSLNFSLTNQIVEDLFKKFDRDHDGFVTYDDLHPVFERAYYSG